MEDYLTKEQRGAGFYLEQDDFNVHLKYNGRTVSIYPAAVTVEEIRQAADLFWTGYQCGLQDAPVRLSRRRRVHRHVCWLCGKDFKITVPPYQRNNWGYCTCEEEGRIGGNSYPPDSMTQEQIEKAIEEYKESEENRKRMK